MTETNVVAKRKMVDCETLLAEYVKQTPESEGYKRIKRQLYDVLDEVHATLR